MKTQTTGIGIHEVEKLMFVGRQDMTPMRLDTKIVQKFATATASWRTICDSCQVDKGSNHTKDCFYFIQAKKKLENV